MTQKKDPLVKHIRKYLKHRENAISCIEDYLNVDVQDYQPVYEVLDQWDYDNPNQRYYTLTKALVTLTNQQQALVKMGYFGQIDLLRDWTQEITKLKVKISPATFETNQTVVEQYNLLPTFALAFTNFETPQIILSVDKLDENGNSVPNPIPSKISYVSLINNF
jgi:hypothetical protein